MLQKDKENSSVCFFFNFTFYSLCEHGKKLKKKTRKKGKKKKKKKKISKNIPLLTSKRYCGGFEPQFKYFALQFGSYCFCGNRLLTKIKKEK